MLDDQENKVQKDKTIIKVNEPVELTFALRYLNNFAKASSLTDSVLLSISEEIPLVVEFSLDDAVVDKGFLRFYLAPKLDE
jgi:proliferating cell nuclear antigen